MLNPKRPNDQREDDKRGRDSAAQPGPRFLEVASDVFETRL